jgi:hypothetical protein
MSAFARLELAAFFVLTWVSLTLALITDAGPPTCQ